MPQLKSGRQVGISADAIFHGLKHGTDLQVSAQIIFIRLRVHTPEQLLEHIAVLRERVGATSDQPQFEYADLSVGQVLAGTAEGWSAEEIAEFRDWLHTDPRVARWLEEQFAIINKTIQANLVWDTPFWTDDDTEKPDQ